ncbi:RNA methyltransferase [Corynebacterium uropygiale]|uniref:RNA methyltransferase n=1 Tax=Corynebacterium uropygiale TaxID=1775911 RepID=A0A9X1U0E4_9CORY|nr:RNA methyltransferase [Corynebacterium uropygiale]MCF4006724.1 RNA methyltransferase [Corynebacterium uropygiale]
MSPQRVAITSSDDPRVNDIRDLNSSDKRPDLPGGRGLVVAEGPLVVGRLLESAYPVRQIVGFPHKLDDFLSENEVPADIPIYEVSRELLAEVAGFDMHRGLLATADRIEQLSPEQVLDGASTVMVLEGVGDHENIGAMFRNVAGLGIDGVLFGSGCADPLYRRSVRVSMGHVLRVPWARLEGTYTTWQRSLDVLRERGFRLISLTPDPGAAHLAQALRDEEGRPWEKVALLVGAEGPGLTEHAMKATDVRARIPMAPHTDSLNVATSAAVACWERVRLRGLDEEAGA